VTRARRLQSHLLARLLAVLHHLYLSQHCLCPCACQSSRSAPAPYLQRGKYTFTASPRLTAHAQTQLWQSGGAKQEVVSKLDTTVSGTTPAGS
jgi:hypothetical protein